MSVLGLMDGYNKNWVEGKGHPPNFCSTRPLVLRGYAPNLNADALQLINYLCLPVKAFR